MHSVYAKFWQENEVKEENEPENKITINLLSFWSKLTVVYFNPYCIIDFVLRGTISTDSKST